MLFSVLPTLLEVGEYSDIPVPTRAALPPNSVSVSPVAFIVQGLAFVSYEDACLLQECYRFTIVVDHSPPFARDAWLVVIRAS